LPGAPATIALTGIASATKRIEAASHNVANLQTEEFQPVRVRQSARAAGGSIAEAEVAARPEPVSVAREFIESDLAAIQAKASARLVKADLELLGSLLDILA